MACGQIKAPALLPATSRLFRTGDSHPCPSKREAAALGPWVGLGLGLRRVSAHPGCGRMQVVTACLLPHVAVVVTRCWDARGQCPVGSACTRVEPSLLVCWGLDAGQSLVTVATVYGPRRERGGLLEPGAFRLRSHALVSRDQAR